jgi:V/A-type H+/Na+-transporting ATPase subunit K
MLLFMFQLVLLPMISVVAVFALSPPLSQEPTNTATTGSFDKLGLAIGAGLAVGLACLGAGKAIAASGTAAISALAEKPETFFKSFLVVALAEALAIYGLIVAILLWISI